MERSGPALPVTRTRLVAGGRGRARTPRTNRAATARRRRVAHLVRAHSWRSGTRGGTLRLHGRGLIHAAAGSAIFAAHHERLARSAGMDEGHPFLRKYALYCGGRWPLGIYEDGFGIF